MTASDGPITRVAEASDGPGVSCRLVLAGLVLSAKHVGMQRVWAWWVGMRWVEMWRVGMRRVGARRVGMRRVGMRRVSVRAGARWRAALRAGFSTPAGQINAVMFATFGCGCAVFSLEEPPVSSPNEPEFPLYFVIQGKFFCQFWELCHIGASVLWGRLSDPEMCLYGSKP